MKEGGTLKEGSCKNEESFREKWSEMISKAFQQDNEWDTRCLDLFIVNL